MMMDIKGTYMFIVRVQKGMFGLFSMIGEVVKICISERMGCRASGIEIGVDSDEWWAGGWHGQ